MLRRRLLSSHLALALLCAACARELDPDAFRREAEKAYVEMNPGFAVARREARATTFVRGDQVDTLDVGALYESYKASKLAGPAFLESWRAKAEAETQARRRTLEQAKRVVLPVLKSSTWIRAQDLGAIGPAHLKDRIRPWRREMASDLFMLLGVPEERLGTRFASIEEVKNAPEGEDAWVERALTNLRAQVGTATASTLNDSSGGILVHDFSGVENVSGLIFDAKFRQGMLEKFGKDELGAAAPIRDVLVIFDASNIAAVRPIRARAHQLHDTQNHPGFRGLIRFDHSTISILEPANPATLKPASPE